MVPSYPEFVFVLGKRLAEHIPRNGNNGIFLQLPKMMFNIADPTAILWDQTS